MKSIKFMLLGIALILAGIFCGVMVLVNAVVLPFIGCGLAAIGLAVCGYGFFKPIYDDAVYEKKPPKDKDGKSQT